MKRVDQGVMIGLPWTLNLLDAVRCASCSNNTTSTEKTWPVWDAFMELTEHAQTKNKGFTQI